MIEVLVAMVIVSVGLLGVAAMVMNGLENNRSAYLRTQASNLVYDMADRMRMNRDRADNYVGFSTSDDTTLPSCMEAEEGCDASGLEAADKAEWARQVNGVDGNFSMLPDAKGSIATDGDGYRITISWSGEGWDDSSSEVKDQQQEFDLRFNL